MYSETSSSFSHGTDNRNLFAGFGSAPFVVDEDSQRLLEGDIVRGSKRLEEIGSHFRSLVRFERASSVTMYVQDGVRKRGM